MADQLQEGPTHKKEKKNKDKKNEITVRTTRKSNNLRMYTIK